MAISGRLFGTPCSPCITTRNKGKASRQSRLLGSATQDTESCRCCKESTTLPQESYRRIDVEKVGRL